MESSIAKKQVWEIVSVKDPVMNQVLKTKLKDREKKIYMDTKRLWYGIVNNCSAVILPGGRIEGMRCTLAGALDTQLNEFESYVVDVLQNNLDKFSFGRLNSQSAVLKGEKGEKEISIAPYVAPPPPPKTVWVIYSVQDPVLDKVLRSEYSEAERRIQIESGKLTFHLVNRCWSGLVEPDTDSPNHDPYSYKLYRGPVCSSDDRMNALQGFVRDIVENNLNDFLAGKFDSKSVILRGRDGQAMTIAPVTI